MSVKLTQFVTEWLHANVVGHIASADDVPHLVDKCERAASAQGITRCEIEAELGPLERCIREAMKRHTWKRSRSPKTKRPRPLRHH